MKAILKENKGITLVALVVTIVVLLILSGITINMAIGENGIITKAQETARKTNEIQANSQSYLNELQQDVAKELANADIEIYLDKTESNVNSVIITIEGTIKDDEIIEIECPDGSKVQGNIATYEVNKNGEYVFWIRTKKGRHISRSISVTNIKEDGIDLTGLVTGEDKHNHIYETKYDNNNHWSECIICGNRINVASHNKVLSGNPATCDVYVNLGKEVCTDNCGYEKQVERLEHIRPEKLSWQDYLGIEHIVFQCERCGGRGSNGLIEYHTFDINGKIMNFMQMINEGIDVHKCGIKQCTVCKLNIDLNKHSFYSNTCYLCGKQYGPTATIEVKQNILIEDEAKIDLINNDIQYVYVNVDTKGLNLYSVAAKSLLGGNYQVGIPQLLDKQGNLWTYKVPISLKDRTKNITEKMELLFEWNSSIGTGEVLDGIYIGYGSLREEISPNIIPVNTRPTIISIEQINEKTVGEWTTKKKLKIKGTCPKREIVYISMYDDTGKAIFENKATQVINGNYEYISDYGIEAFRERNFTIKVKDIFENEEQQILKLSKVDSQAPSIISDKEYNKEWSKNKFVELQVEEKGIGEVQIAFNDESDYKYAEKKDGNYIRNYKFIGDIYQEMQGAIYLKDGLGNIRTERISIGKIDGTSPTITKVETRKEEENIVVTITANDINEKLGQEGSGVGGYAITNTKQLPEDSMYQENNEIQLQESGIYYVYVKDKVGNISARYELNI